MVDLHSWEYGMLVLTYQSSDENPRLFWKELGWCPFILGPKLHETLCAHFQPINLRLHIADFVGEVLETEQTRDRLVDLFHLATGAWLFLIEILASKDNGKI